METTSDRQALLRQVLDEHEKRTRPSTPLEQYGEELNRSILGDEMSGFCSPLTMVSFLDSHRLMYETNVALGSVKPNEEGVINMNDILLKRYLNEHIINWIDEPTSIMECKVREYYKQLFGRETKKSKMDMLYEIADYLTK